MNQKETCNTTDKQADISFKTEKQYKRGEHPKSQANLQPFEKGISGNPGGRSLKYEQLKKALNRIGELSPDSWRSNDTYKDSVLERESPVVLITSVIDSQVLLSLLSILSSILFNCSDIP